MVVALAMKTGHFNLLRTYEMNPRAGDQANRFARGEPRGVPAIFSGFLFRGRRDLWRAARPDRGGG